MLAMLWDAGLAILGVYRIPPRAKGAPPRGDPRHGDSRRKRADGDFADTGKEVQLADYRR